jgi:hypothetical protein
MQKSKGGPFGNAIDYLNSKDSLNAKREAASNGEMIEILQPPRGLEICLILKSNPANPSMKDFTKQTALTCVEDQMARGVTIATTSGR